MDAVDLNKIRVLILTGAGEKSFVSGTDIGEMNSLTKEEGEVFEKKKMTFSVKSRPSRFQSSLRLTDSLWVVAVKFS